MQHFSNNDHLAGDEAVEAVSRYVAGLQRVMPPATGSGRALDAGAAEFARSCASCHGPQGQAVASRGIPALARQHASYLERKMREAAAGQNSIGGRRTKLNRTISSGDHLSNSAGARRGDRRLALARAALKTRRHCSRLISRSIVMRTSCASELAPLLVIRGLVEGGERGSRLSSDLNSFS